MTHKLLDQIDRDIRNQVLINSYLKPTRRQRIMIRLHRLAGLNWTLISGLVFCFLIWLTVGRAFADELPKTTCPTAEPCRIIVLSQSEERLLMQPNGLIDTAAQARALDLGQFAVYLKQKIASAPAGEMQKPPEKHDAPQGNPALGGGTPPNPANNSADPVDKK